MQESFSKRGKKELKVKKMNPCHDKNKVLHGHMTQVQTLDCTSVKEKSF